MRIAYFDEAGDDGVPGSSPLFVLGSLYMHYLHWQGNYDRVQILLALEPLQEPRPGLVYKEP